MSKRKKKSPRPGPGNLPRRLSEGLNDAESLLANENIEDALGLLLELEEKYPNNPDVLGVMANAYIDSGNMRSYLHAMYRLHKLTPNRPDVKLGLAGGYLANNRPALALRTFRQFLKRWPKDERAADVHNTISELEAGIRENLDKLDFSLETGLDFECRHEELQVLMGLENFERCKKMAKSLLKQRPEFVPVLNNLSLIYWLEGNLSAASETSQEVLKRQTDNIHALSNLVRFFWMQGETDKSLALAKKLKESNAEAADRWIKKAEAFSFIGDDEGVLALLGEAKKAGELEQLNEVVWHLCAVAEYRQGNTAKARRYWQKCLKLAPFNSYASANLEELKKPLHERICPQVYGIQTWLPKQIIKDLIPALEKDVQQKRSPVFQKKWDRFLNDHPESLHCIPAALSNGDEVFRKFAILLADIFASPKSLEQLKTFALGQEGPDSLRMEAAQILSKHGFFEPSEHVNMWLKGEWHSVLMLGFEITSGAIDKPNFKPNVEHLSEQAVNALREGDGATAEKYLRKALKIQPSEPSILNNLGVSLHLQGKNAESEAIADQIIEQYPDYFFGQVMAARKAIQSEDFDEAQAILDKVMKKKQKKQLHITEFGSLCACQVELMLAEDNFEGVSSWIELWKQGYPDDPAIENYEAQIAAFEASSNLKEGFQTE